jgi:hypothetical protein
VSSSVIVNHLTVVHKSSDGIRASFPDVCKTPMAPSPVPIPYPNTAMSSDAADTAGTVKADGNPIMVKDSKFRTSTGDEAGSLLGVLSNKVKGTANPVMFSMDVKAEGKNVFRQFDLMLGNGNTNNDLPNPDGQPGQGAAAPGQDPKKYKIIETKWTKEKCKCGDMVRIETTGENLDGKFIPHMLFRMEDTPPVRVGLRGAPMVGGKVELDWLSVHGSWRKPPSKFNILCDGLGGPKESAEPLTIEIPPDKTELNLRGEFAFRALVEVQVPGPAGPKTDLQWWGREYGHRYGYDRILKGGILTIVCKIKLTPKGQWTPARLAAVKSRARREITTCWNRKYKFHRKDCKRGRGCGCTRGCCVFPIQVACKFVEAGQHIAMDLHAGEIRIGGPAEWDAKNLFERLARWQRPNPPPYAHEFGHAIGMIDEYAGSSLLKEHYNDRESIMARGDQVRGHHWTEYPSEGESPHAWLEQHAGDKYEVLPVTAS